METQTTQQREKFDRLKNLSDDRLRLECMQESDEKLRQEDPAYKYLTLIRETLKRRISNGENSNHYTNPFAPDLQEDRRVLEEYRMAIKDRTISEEDYTFYANLGRRYEL